MDRSEPQIVPVKSHSRQFLELVGTALKVRIEKLTSIKTGKGCGCDNLANKMDAWGMAGCELHREEIVNHLVSNRDILTEALKEWCSVAWMVSTITPDVLLSQGANWILTQAIEDVRKQPKPDPVIRAPVVRTATQPTQRGAAQWIKGLKATQAKLHAETMAKPKPSPDPFEGVPILHFGAHLWPTKNNWQWHVQLWNQMPALINGQCFVGIATDPSTDTHETIRAALHASIICKEFTNHAHGETQTFRWLQEVVPQGSDDVLIYCHGKGAKTNTSKSEAVRRWSEAMYQTIVFNHDMIREKLAAGYKNCHSFRTFGTRPLSPRFAWHPSGTFFAVRAKYLAGKPVKDRYGGVEAWCGDHFPAHESWCEFYDNSMFTTLYNHKESTEIVLPMLIEWNRKQAYEGRQ
jgi:hypothetical protein